MQLGWPPNSRHGHCQSSCQLFKKEEVRWFSEQKGFGFIVGDDDEEYFFGVRDIVGIDLPHNGDVVTFEPAEGAKGPKATQVTITWKDDSQRDDRAICGDCGRKMVPRIITGPPLIHGRGGWTPVPKKSICPYCAGTYQEFPSSTGDRIEQVIVIIIFIAIAGHFLVGYLSRFIY